MKKYTVLDTNGNKVGLNYPDIGLVIIARSKAIKVIDSCETIEQFNTAKKYAKQYFKFSGDFIGYEELSKKIENLISKIIN